MTHLTYKNFYIRLLLNTVWQSVLLSYCAISTAQNKSDVFNTNDFVSKIHEARKKLDTMKVEGNFYASINGKKGEIFYFLNSLKDEKELYIETKISPELLQSQGKSFLSDDIEYTEKLIFDGRDTYMFAPRAGFQSNKPSQISVVHRFISFTGIRELGFTSNFISGSIENALQSGKFVLDSVRMNRKYGLIHDFVGKIDSTLVKFSVSSTYGYLVVDSSQEFTANGKLILNSFHIDEVKNFKGGWVPTAVTLNYGEMASGTNMIHSQRFYSFSKFDMDSVENAIFEPKVSTHAIFADDTNETMWHQSPTNEKVYIASNKHHQKVMYFGWLYMASVSSLLVLTVGAYVKWKRKQLSKQA